MFTPLTISVEQVQNFVFLANLQKYQTLGHMHSHVSPKNSHLKVYLTCAVSDLILVFYLVCSIARSLSLGTCKLCTSLTTGLCKLYIYIYMHTKFYAEVLQIEDVYR